MGSVTSLSLTADGTHFFCGTSKATIYWCNTDDIAPELRNTCHYERINDVQFPTGYSELFATCSLNDIRVWNTKTRQEREVGIKPYGIGNQLVKYYCTITIP